MRNIVFLLVLLSNISYGKDYGIGVIYFSAHGVNSSSFQTDSMSIFAEPSRSSKIIAKLRQIAPKGDKAPYQYIVTPSMRGVSKNIVEFAYEESGLPFDSVNETRNWVRAVYGLSDSNISYKGWVEVQSPHTEIIFWSVKLKQRDVFFLSISPVPKFFDEPNGNEVEFPLVEFKYGERRYNYIMHPLKSEGSWLQVLVVTPSDFCENPLNPKKKILWIRYLDDSGRPLVFYYSRGC
ncbi:MAG: hypothetical protein NT002_03390 [candidate division Zixibacteria bacterium]|nr:hypothetical protein [candidate division Zixibacteria bacterium]